MLSHSDDLITAPYERISKLNQMAHLISHLYAIPTLSIRYVWITNSFAWHTHRCYLIRMAYLFIHMTQLWLPSHICNLRTYPSGIGIPLLCHTDDLLILHDRVCFRYILIRKTYYARIWPGTGAIVWHSKNWTYVIQMNWYVIHSR